MFSRYVAAAVCGVMLLAARTDAQAPVALGAVSSLSGLTTATRTLYARVGPEENPFEAVAPSSSGQYFVQLPAAGRLHLDLGGPVDTGYQAVGNDLRALPVGSTLAAEAGQFAWAPPVPFYGPFNLIFVSGNTRLNVVATITDPTTPAGVQLQIDAPVAGSAHAPLVVAGWALDPLATAGTGVDTLHVWAYRRDIEAEPQFLGAAAIGGQRPDVAAAYGAQFEAAGFSLTTPFLWPGTYDLLVYPWSHRTGRFEAAKSVRVVIN